MTTAKVTVTAPGDREIVMKRFFDAPHDLAILAAHAPLMTVTAPHPAEFSADTQIVVANRERPVLGAFQPALQQFRFGVAIEHQIARSRRVALFGR